MGICSDGKHAYAYPTISRDDLVVKEQLGCGSFGSVYRGIWRNGDREQIVALKKVFMLEKEVDILSQIRHKNIIHFYGVSEASLDFYIVTEFAENGSLYEYLHNNNGELAFDRILQWALEIAYGVSYLHNDAPATIIHRDLKSKNIVLSKAMVCKLCDFGTSKDLTHSFTLPTWGGTAAWMSPEIINQKEGITTASDVWSYGVVLWELVSRQVPYNGLTEFKIYSIITQYDEKLAIPESCPYCLADLLKSCWHTNPVDRIDMRTIIDGLTLIKENELANMACKDFVNKKAEWKHVITTQLSELNAMKIDLARQKEELERREQAITKRETSHRSFMHLHFQELLAHTVVDDWTYDDVCCWLAVIADTSPTKVDEELVDKLIECIRTYEINGTRLLGVTSKDLIQLGVNDTDFREYMLANIDELGSQSVYNILEYPSLKMSAIIELRNKSDKTKQPFDFPLIIHLGYYYREAASTTCSTRVRFKVFVDTDWQHCTMKDTMPAEIYDSATVIKDVSITLVDSNKRVLLETVKCFCPPFGFLEWIVAPHDGSSVHVTCAVSYTDQVIQPRNTCIKTDITTFNMPQTLQNKVVMLRMKPIATNTSISRVNSALFSPAPASSLQAPWKNNRRRSSATVTDSALSLLKTQAWSAVAGGYQHQHSYNKDDPVEFPSLRERTDSNASRGDKSPFYFPRLHLQTHHRRRDSETNDSNTNSSKDSGHASFFVDSASPSGGDENNIFSDQKTNAGDTTEQEEESEEKCCKNNCRHRPVSHTPVEVANLDDIQSMKTNKKKKRKDKKSVSSAAPALQDKSTTEIHQDDKKESKTSQIYGGYNKWKWR